MLWFRFKSHSSFLINNGPGKTHVKDDVDDVDENAFEFIEDESDDDGDDDD